MSSSIPLELIERIMEHLPQDLLILRNMCLVNKAFAASCQRILFHRVILHINPDAFIVHYSSSKAKELRDALTESPHLLPFIREIRLAFASPLNTLHKEPYTKDPHVPEVLDFIGPIRRLELTGPSSFYIYIWTDIPSMLLSAIEKKVKSSSLASLYISNCRNFPLDFLGLCDQLLDLELAHVTFWDLASTSVDVWIPSRTLLLKGVHFPGAKANNWRFLAPRLKVLKCIVYQEIELSSLDRIIWAAKKTIEDVALRIEGHSPGRPGLHDTFSNMSHLQNLRRIQLTSLIWRNGPIYPWFFSCLESMDAPVDVEFLVLSLVFTDCDHEKWSEDTLARIAERLDGDKWAKLRLITFNVFSDNRETSQQVIRKIRAYMHSLDARGALRISALSRAEWSI